MFEKSQSKKMVIVSALLVSLVFCLMASARPSWSLAADAPDTGECKMFASEHGPYDGLDSYECAVNDFVFNGAGIELGKISGDTVGELGAAKRVENSPVSNPERQAQEDSIKTLHYDGISVAVYTEKKSGAKFVDKICVSDKKFELAGGLKVGSTKNEVAAALGTPTQTGDVWRYETFESPSVNYDSPEICEGAFAEIHFNGDAVAKVVFDYRYYNYYRAMHGRDDFKSHGFLESYRMRNSTRAVRDGEKLTLKLDGQKTRSYKNDNTDGESYRSYVYCGYIEKINYYVVKLTYFEGSDVIMVNAKTGKEFKIPARPCLSPDAKLFAAVSTDAAYGFNGIQVWKAGKDGLKKEWQKEGSTLYKFEGWDGPNSFRVSSAGKNGKTGETDDDVRIYMVVKPGKKGWTMEAEKSAGTD